MRDVPTESIRDLRARLAEIVDRADRDDEPTVITKHGRPVAAVVPVAVLEEHLEREETALARIVEERRTDGRAGIPIEDVIAETLARRD